MRGGSIYHIKSLEDVVYLDGKALGVPKNDMTVVPPYMLFQRGMVEGYKLKGLRDALKAVREKRGDVDVEIGMTRRMLLFADDEILEFEHEVEMDAVKVRLIGDETVAVAKLLDDQEGDLLVRESLLPSSQMRLVYEGGISFGLDYVAPYTVRRNSLGRRKLGDVDMAVDYLQHLYFVLALKEGQEKKQGGLGAIVMEETFLYLREIDRPFCYQVVLRVDGQEYEQDVYINSDTRGRTYQNCMTMRCVLPDEVDAKMCDVILRPAAKYAYKTAHLAEILGHEIIYEDVDLMFITDEEIERAKKGVVDLRERAYLHTMESMDEEMEE